MMRIYTTPGSASCRKAKAWLKKNQIPFIEKNMFTSFLKDSEIIELLERCENGTDDIISKNSKIMKENDIDIDSMSINELIEFIKKNPSILKRPIMIDEKGFQVGYSDEEIRIFIPKELRQVQDHTDKESPH